MELILNLVLTDKSTVTVPNTEVDRITWKGKQTYTGFKAAKVWIVVLYDGTEYSVNPSDLDNITYETLKDVMFAG